MSYEDIVAQANIPHDFVQNAVPFSSYHRSALNLYKQAGLYVDNDVTQSFIFYHKFVNLVLLELPHHNAYNAVSNRKLRHELMKLAKDVLDVLETMKPLVKSSLESPSVAIDASIVDMEAPIVEKTVDTMEDDAWKSVGVSPEAVEAQFQALSVYQGIEVPPVKKPVLIPTLRHIYVPNLLQSTFTRMSEPHTNKDIEMCGILAGKLDIRTNSFSISHLIKPKQTCGRNFCELLGDDAVFEYQDKNQLMPLGWIHTHPTQTVFLSSVDVHTQFTYQILLDEAISVVISPKNNPSIGCFNLTDAGMAEVRECRTDSVEHHVHSNVYQEASHVTFVDANLLVVDLSL